MDFVFQTSKMILYHDDGENWPNERMSGENHMLGVNREKKV